MMTSAVRVLSKKKRRKRQEEKEKISKQVNNQKSVSSSSKIDNISWLLHVSENCICTH